MTATVPNTISIGSIPRFLKHIQTAGVPAKVTNSYLKSVGFKSSNDSALINILKALDFIDHGGAPTQRWTAYRDNTQAKSILAEAIRTSYAGLFEVYPDAERKDDEALANWIRSNTNFAGITVQRAVRTFKALCAEADFGAAPATAPSSTPQNIATATAPSASAPAPAMTLPGGPSVNINVELHLPSTNDPQVYENFFKSMKTYLFNEEA